MTRIREEYVIERAGVATPLVILDRQVIDLSGFLAHHPGGLAVLLANLGRDVSADFHHVPAHARDGVLHQVQRLAIAEIDRVAVPTSRPDLTRLADYVRLVLNSFVVLSCPERDPVQDLLYVGQVYSQFVGDHLHEFLQVLSSLAQAENDARTSQMLNSVFVATPELVDRAIMAKDPVSVSKLSHQMQERCVALLRQVLEVCVKMSGVLRDFGGGDEFSALGRRAIKEIRTWADEEHGIVVGQQS